MAIPNGSIVKINGTPASGKQPTEEAVDLSAYNAELELVVAGTNVEKEISSFVQS